MKLKNDSAENFELHKTAIARSHTPDDGTKPVVPPAALKQVIWNNMKVQKVTCARCHNGGTIDADGSFAAGRAFGYCTYCGHDTFNVTCEAPVAPEPAKAEASCGVELIAAERTRQVKEEEWTAYHDDHLDKKELSHAAAAYLSAYWFPGMTGIPGQWPKDWGNAFWKPSPDPVRNLVKAGALIAAEIDRLNRKQK